MTTGPCAIWGTSADVTRQGDGLLIDSPRAGGKYYISDSAQEILKSKTEKQKAMLTTWLVDQRRLGVDEPRVSSDVFDDAAIRKQLRVGERRDRMLMFIESKTEHFWQDVLWANNGREGKFNGYELLAWTESTKDEELRGLKELCADEYFVKSKSDTSDHAVYLTAKGYSHLDVLRRTAIASAQGFIAMWFDSSMDQSLVKGFDRAISDAGYSPKRLDKTEHNNRVDDEIIAEIRRSRFLVADFTCLPKQPRGGVYFEAGFAYGLGVPVIWTCAEDSKGDLHFDTRQFNHILWTNADDLYRKLKVRIEATIGDGPYKTVK